MNFAECVLYLNLCCYKTRRDTLVCPLMLSADIDECASNPCVNGECTDGENSWECTCVVGYSGYSCEGMQFVLVALFISSHSITHV